MLNTIDVQISHYAHNTFSLFWIMFSRKERNWWKQDISYDIHFSLLQNKEQKCQCKNNDNNDRILPEVEKASKVLKF